MTRRFVEALSEPSFMEVALRIAEQAAGCGEVPVGAVVVVPETREILASAGNRVETENDPTAHAEILAIRAASSVCGTPRLCGCDIYVTLEPCPMCAQAISFSRLRRLYYGCDDAKGGGVINGARIFSQDSCHHRPEVYGGIDETRAAELLRSFFEKHR